MEVTTDIQTEHREDLKRTNRQTTRRNRQTYKETDGQVPLKTHTKLAWETGRDRLFVCWLVA